MGRQQNPVDPADPAVMRFALRLRLLREEAGNISYRQLAERAHYSRTALSAAASGRQMPTMDVAVAFASACGADPEVWRRRWKEAMIERSVAAGEPLGPVARIDAAGSPQPVADGSDPERAGCHHDKMTVHGRKIATAEQRILGAVELRYSPATHAAWGRFTGTSALDHLAGRRQVDIEIDVRRHSDGARASFRLEYCFDTHWSDILLTLGQTLSASVTVYVDGGVAAVGETEALALP